MKLIKNNIIVLALPIAVYIFTFGFHISDIHQRWGEMGSAMSGIYSTLFSALTLIFLFKQYKLQELSIEQYEAQAWNNDFNYYLSELDKKLSTTYEPGVTIKDNLIENFSNIESYSKSPEGFYEYAKSLNQNKSFAEN